MELRLMQKDDFSVLYDLWKKVGLGLSDVAEEEQQLEIMLKCNPGSCFVATNNGAIIGSVVGTFAGGRAWISHLAVLPEYQQKGIGSRLESDAINALKKKGACSIFLMIRLDNLKVVPFYEKHGFCVKHSLVMKKVL